MKKYAKMKRTIALLMVMAMILCTSAFALAEAPSVAPVETAATNILIDYAVRLAFALLMTLLGVFGAWLTAVVGKNERMRTVSKAIGELIDATKTTAASLQQTVVDGLKAAHEDHKLTKEEIAMLGVQLKEKTLQKLSEPAYKVLEAASVDIEAWITDTAEEWINKMKMESGVLIAEVPEE